VPTRNNGPLPETRINLPASITDLEGVFLNGVPLAEGTDYSVVGRELIIHQELIKEGKLGFWRWFFGAWGVGFYKRNDVIDVRHRRNGRTTLAHDLAYEANPVPN